MLIFTCRHMASRVTIGSPVQMQLVKLPVLDEGTKKGEKVVPLSISIMIVDLHVVKQWFASISES